MLIGEKASTAKLRCMELRYFELPVLSNSYNQCK